MKALVLTAPMTLELMDVPEPEVGQGEVLVEVKACGICGSDVHGLDGSTGRRRPPIIMGHEAAGVIARVGPGVTDWQAGDRVTFDSTIYCGRCEYCARGQVNLCDNRRVLGVSCADYRQHGAFAQYVAVPQRILYRLPERMGFERAAMVEAVAIAMHAVERAGPQPGQCAVVIGAGTIGLLAVQILRAVGCNVIAVDVDADRLELADRLGAHVVLRSGQDNVPAAVRERTGGAGSDLAVEAVGVEATVQQAIDCLRKGGRLALVGNLVPRVGLPLQAVVTREITLAGSCASCGEYKTSLDMLDGSFLHVEPMISAVAPLADGPTWFDRLYRKEPGLMKVILTP